MVISYSQKVALEIITVLAVVLIIKYFLLQFNLAGSGSYGIWSGIIAATLFMSRRNLKWADFGLGLPKGAKQWIAQLGLGLFACTLMLLVGGLSENILTPTLGLSDAGDSSYSGLLQGDVFAGRPLAFIVHLILAIWIGAALGEELLFRGFLLNQLKSFFGNGRLKWILAILLQAIIFGALHNYQGSSGMVARGLTAVVLGVFYLVTNQKLFPLILAHGFYNTLFMVWDYVKTPV